MRGQQATSFPKKDATPKEVYNHMINSLSERIASSLSSTRRISHEDFPAELETFKRKVNSLSLADQYGQVLETVEKANNRNTLQIEYTKQEHERVVQET